MTTPYEMKQREIEEAGGYWSYLNKKFEKISIEEINLSSIVIIPDCILLPCKNLDPCKIYPENLFNWI